MLEFEPFSLFMGFSAHSSGPATGKDNPESIADKISPIDW